MNNFRVTFYRKGDDKGMRKKPFGVMRGRLSILWCMAVLLSATFPAKAILAGQEVVSCPPLAGAQGVDKCELSEAKRTQQSLSGCVDKTAKAEIVQKVKKLQIPFIANKGQIDKKVKFYANTFGGTVFVTKDGEIVYSLPGGKNEEFGSVGVNGLTPMLGSEQGKDTRSRDVDARSEPNKILTLKETIVGGKINEVKGEKKAITNVNYFKGKDPSKWKTSILTYDVINLGEVYEGIELKLKAHGNNVEKLFCVRPGGEIESIKMKLGGAKALKLDKEGQLEVKTELGAVKFTKPVAYQEIHGEKVEVDVEYCIQEKDAIGQKSELRRQKSGFLNPKSKISTPQLEYSFKVASYDKTKDLIIDPLLASTYVGGSNYDRALSIAIDTSGNVYVGGSTISSNFPTTSGIYDTSFNGGDSDAFLLRFNSDITNLLASTYLGGTKDDYIYSIDIGTDGNIYMCGDTGSSDFPTTTGVYDTSINNVSNYYDGFVSKLDSGLTSLLASTYLGGSNSDHPRSLTIDNGGNIYISGTTYSSDFPVTTGVYDTSFNGGLFDSFISKFNGTLTSLLSSTYIGGSGNESSQSNAPSLAIDTSGNILVTGTTYSSDFPTTTGAYDTSRGGDRDAFVSKISGDLTNLLASTYLGGSIYDEGYSIAGDSSGNIYVVGYTYSGCPRTQ